MSEQEQGDKVLEGARIGKEIESKKIDINPFLGKKTRIREMVIKTRKMQKQDVGMVDSYYVQVKTEPVGKTPEGEPMYASKLFGLKKDADSGEIGWSNQGKLAAFLKAKGVSHPDDIIGVEVTTKASDPDSNGNEWLTF